MSQREVDIIIAGGGASGCVLAGRLAAADPTLSILLIEAGPNNLANPTVVTPGLFLTHLVPDSKTAAFHVGKGTKHLDGRGAVVPSGSVLGGGASINFMMYTRAAESDYNDWAQPGWSAKEVTPFIKKSENYHVTKDSPDHGYGGPMSISHGGHLTDVGKEWVVAAKEWGTLPELADLQNGRSAHGVEHWAKWIDPKTGLRSEPAHAYVHPEMSKNQNLQLLTEAKVKRVIFEGDRATGIEYIPNKALDPSAPQDPITIRARKLVVLSAGACSTPLILQRSGVGPAAILKEHNIPVVKENEAVGAAYLDHSVVLASYKAKDGADTLDPLLRQEVDFVAKVSAEFGQQKGILSTNSVDCGFKFRPTPEQIDKMGPAFQARWKQKYESAKDKPLFVSAMVACYIGDPTSVPRGNYFTCFSFLTHPTSRGFCNITSGEDVYAPADFDPGFLSHDSDMAPLILAYKTSREISHRMPSYRGEVAKSHPIYPAGSAAACEENTEGPSTQDIVYTKDDEKAIETWMRVIVQTCYHSAGTTAMGTVVDSSLSVIGLKGLKVVDLGIMPRNVAANPASTAFMIGEKAAAIIQEELGIKTV